MRTRHYSDVERTIFLTQLFMAIFLLLIAIGGGVLLITYASSLANQPEPTVATCDGAVMQPGDLCQHSTIQNGVTTSNYVNDYDQQLAENRSEHDSWTLWYALGVVIIASAILFLLYCIRRWILWAFWRLLGLPVLLWSSWKSVSRSK